MSKNNNKLVIILSIIVVVLLACFIALVVIFGMNNNIPDEDIAVINDKLISEEEQNKLNAQAKIAEALSKLTLIQDFRKSLTHGPKPAANQKWIVLHDTEGDGRAENVVSG